MEKNKEIWKSWDKYPMIRVSNFGRFKNIQTGTFYKLWNNKRDKLLFLSFKIKSKLIRISAGKLILTLFLRPPLFAERVKFLDNNQSNLKLENLKWERIRSDKSREYLLKSIQIYSEIVTPYDNYVTLSEKLKINENNLQKKISLLKKEMGIQHKRYYVYSIIHSWLAIRGDFPNSIRQEM